MAVKAPRGSEESTETCRVRWTKGKALVPCDSKRYGKRIPSIAELDFKSLGVSVKGLLSQTLHGLELPCHLKRFRQFRLAVTQLAADPGCNHILSTPAENLSTRHIAFLFDRHEKYLQAEGTWANLPLLGSQFRAYFRRNPARLSCGSRISDTNFRTALVSTKPAAKTTLISEFEDPHSPEGFQLPISSLPHADLADLQEKAKRHLEIRMDRIANACWASIEDHRELAKSIREQKERPIPVFKDVFNERAPLAKSLPSTILWRVKILQSAGNEKEDVSTYVWHWVAAACLVTRPDAWGKCLAPLCLGTGLATWPDAQGGAGGRASLFFSDYFLSHDALLGCQYLLQIHGGWNPDTVRAMTAGNVQREADGSFIIRPFKPKSGQYLPPRHVGKGERIHEVVELLLAHRVSVDQLVPHNHPSLFVGYQRSHKLFGLFNPKRAHKSLIDKHRLAPFAAGQLRDQKANSVYLNEGRDVLHLKEYLGHADLQSVDTYLNHTIQRVLSAANMEEFTRRLHQSINWIVGSGPQPENTNTASLLFPADATQEESLCDAWLETCGEIVIGAEQIAHCVWQRAYYISNFDRLRTDDPRRFAVVHLPRIIFCIGLHHVILQSQYRYLIGRFESHVPVIQGVAT